MMSEYKTNLAEYLAELTDASKNAVMDRIKLAEKEIADHLFLKLLLHLKTTMKILVKKRLLKKTSLILTFRKIALKNRQMKNRPMRQLNQKINLN